MNLEHTTTASELESSLSDVISLVEGTLELLDDAAWRHGGDVRYDAFRALIAEVHSRVADMADTVSAIAGSLPEQQ